MRINDVEVIDANHELVVEITPQDVRAGQRKTADTCAASRAICRQIKGAQAAKVQVARAYVMQRGRWVRYKTSPALRTEVICFDRGGTFAPGTYSLIPAPASQRLDAPSYTKKAQVNDGYKPRRRYNRVRGVRARLEADWA